MIAAIALVCSLSDPSDCRSLSNMRLFPTVEMCMKDREVAENVALSSGYGLVAFHCFDWGQTV